MKVVSSNSNDELRRHRALQNVRGPFAVLTINCLRICRGSGKPEEIVHQITQVAEALSEYRALEGGYPTGEELADAIQFDRRQQWQATRDDEYSDLLSAEDRIIFGALQLAASYLADQSTQMTAGEAELYGGVNELRRAELNAETGH